MNSKKHRTTRTKDKQQHYFNGVFPDATNKHHQFEYSDTRDK
jgi:hypothetical protein